MSIIPPGRTSPEKVSNDIIMEWDREYASVAVNVNSLQDQLYRNLSEYREALKTDDHITCNRVWANIQGIQNELSTLKFDHQDDLKWIKWGKKILNAQARKAYLNKIKSGATVTPYYPPYPEVRG